MFVARRAILKIVRMYNDTSDCKESTQPKHHIAIGGCGRLHEFRRRRQVHMR